ncbi:oxygen-insensitive NAD(P)H nitroreductase [Saccharibacter sp. 17.LH.SD]|uniref:oxygen-insensitive NAD(P)H nitroreductase n=1 Tax=Saccharibacter sp. 17.LH.SD TaxID=2689393 RepID=UPI00136AD848|nr:oxygen-insensitive NAD(P)H nitroreductase [Saccharibacter sp. 17.LH.SD]MXV43565.1 oxygen-insensitive NAD(P)H nitroreductase [Saccharibacter sp. 17.LH.SD]
MSLLHTLQKRYTAKAYDASRRIPDETIHQLLEALRLSPSSINAQPWHFIVADDDAGRQRIAKATPDPGPFAYNKKKITEASHVVLLCARTHLSDAYVDALLAKEKEDGRFNDDNAFNVRKETVKHYVGQHVQAGDVAEWNQRQLYIAQGFLLLSAGLLNVDATPIEGFDAAIAAKEFDLEKQGLTPMVIVSLGYHAEGDSNATRPKSRLSADVVFSKA